MEITVKSRGLEFGDSLREYAERKVSKLDRFFPDILKVDVELAVENVHDAEKRHVAQITLRGNHGVILRAEERSSDMRAAIDAALDKMKRQINRYKGKHWEWRVKTPPDVEEELSETLEAEEEGGSNLVVRVKEFLTRPMDVEEAIEQMELLDHDFFIFYNVDTNNYSVVYRRRDGGYGLLLPQLA